MTQHEYQMKLFKEFIRTKEFIPETDYELLEEIAIKYQDNTTALSKLYNDFIDENPLAKTEDLALHYKKIEDSFILAYQSETTGYSKEDFKIFLMGMISLLNDMLPLGSVVTLKNRNENSTPLKVVITYRFLAQKEDIHYFPYGGVVYPVGMLGNDNILYFTESMIDKIVLNGYQDEQEDDFVYLMKKEMLVERQMVSFGYSTKEELESFHNR